MHLDRRECLEWAFGNLLDNANRGKVAEFMVAKALGVAKGQRQEWDYADIFFEGRAIEVKSSAYLQVWKQNKPSKIIFDIAPRKQKWDAKTNTYEDLVPPRRLADLYVFCVFEETDPQQADPLNTEQWSFYVVPTLELNDQLSGQKKVGLKRITGFGQAGTYEDLLVKVSRVVRG